MIAASDNDPPDAQLVALLEANGLGGQPGDRFIEHYEIPRIRAIWAALRDLPDTPLRVLDVGFLDGRVPLVLGGLDRGDRLMLTSTERDGATSDGARERARRLGLDVDVLPLDLIRPGGPIDGRTFDAIVLGEVIEHISGEHLTSLLRRLRGLVRPGGLVVVTTPNLHGLAFRVRHLLGVDFTHDPVPDATMGMPHVGLLSARMLVDLGKSVDLEPVSVRFYDFTSGHRCTTWRRRLTQAIRARTLSQWRPDSRDDMVITLRRVDRASPPSAVFAHHDASLREGLAASVRG